MKHYLNQIHDFGLTNSIIVPTRANSLSGTLIDHFYCSSSEKNAYDFLSDISDHFPIYIKLKHCYVKKNSLKNKN